MKSSVLLINESPLQVLPTLAKIIGLHKAIVLQQIHYWLIQKKAFQRDDRVWVFNTYQQWHEDNFPFWSPRAIQRIILDLEEDGLLIVRQFDLESGDATKYYSINYDQLNSLWKDPSSESGTTHHPNLALPPSESGTTPSESGTFYKEQRLTTETTTEREQPPPEKTITSILGNAYKEIIHGQHHQAMLESQIKLLDQATVAEVEEWLGSRKRPSSINYIGLDFKTWKAGKAKNGQALKHESPALLCSQLPPIVEHRPFGRE